MIPDQLQASVVAFLGKAKAAAAGGLTVAEFGSLTVELLELLVVGLEGVPTDGAAKKVWAIGVVGMLFDSVAVAAVPFWALPVWVVMRPAVRGLVLAAAGGALEQVLSMTRSPIGPAAAPEVKA
ncbi:hypothetical protein UFOVP1124_28 [uncultured Caudovirales phage]|uniref:Uncharacterized protein n=1 Tax=uncultured Caudovirales phage TaxID=2100421 RepID=A0A6J5QJZ9_9CAUD|nr:hypothetical protein UFOVP1124_28 [uncultured Caudovirales phage]